MPGEALVEDSPSDMGTADETSEGEGKSDTESDESESENQAAGMPAYTRCQLEYGDGKDCLNHILIFTADHRLENVITMEVSKYE
ncbi:hypothetical protein FQA39_LY06422 [Lamprigera yunnana]|nr:hypothetical protein FQA39_LY06422 [Lamprigera yunnana]